MSMVKTKSRAKEPVSLISMSYELLSLTKNKSYSKSIYVIDIYELLGLEKAKATTKVSVP